MANILIKSGWLGKNNLQWYINSGDLGDHVVGLVSQLRQRHTVFFSGDADFKQRACDVEIHIERQISFNRKTKKLLIICEPHFVQPQNYILPKLNYEKIFEIDTRASLQDNVVKYRYPRELTQESDLSWDKRLTFISCINANKNAVIRSKYNLYDKRRRFIMALNQAYKENFSLYGGGWDLRNHPVGLLAKVIFRLRWLKPLLRRRVPLVSYKGLCDAKSDVMSQSKFTLCVENTQFPGCMTEKMIDCFRFGSVPLYLGPPDIGDMIDPSLFVDLRAFSDDESLLTFLGNFTEKDYQQWWDRLELHRVDIKARHSISGYINMVSDAVEDVIDRADIK
jgi:hypothetical protein